MALAAQQAGYEVHVATRVHADGAAIEARVHAASAATGGAAAPIRSTASADRRRARLYQRLKPDLVHHVALEPTVIGSLAALGLPLPR